ncbi:methyl-accepting chemotaxis protein [Teredinibacter haidensis]|uniref:methyl-accepting chemotaxis protein n=1 Tax=Teredinibacter haidensis TaxID=2731755 RepID=UPI0009490454|nr:methyl-accepting chemotaxis protein [Teredinibacter haidensis]
MLRNRIHSLLNVLPIEKKIRLIFIPPIVILGIAVLLVLISNIQHIRTANSINNTVDLGLLLDSVAHNFAVERGLTAGYLGSKNTEVRQQLEVQRKKASEAQADFYTYYDSGISHLPENVQVSLSALKKQLATIEKLRSDVDNFYPEAKPFRVYSTLNKTALDTLSLLATTISDARVLLQLNILTDLLWMKERAGQERGALNGIFASGKYTTLKIRDVGIYIADQQVRYEAVARTTAKKDFADLDSSLDTDNTAQIIKLRQTFFSAAEANSPLNVDPGNWFELTTNRIKTIKQFSNRTADTISSSASNLLLKAWLIFIATLLLALVGGIALMHFSNTVTSQLTGNIGKLIEKLNQVRDNKDFSLRVNVNSQDEIGEAAKAFNMLMDQLQQAIAGVTAVMSEVASGNFSARIEQHFEGELNTLKSGVNHSAEKVDLTMQALAKVMEALEAGDFSARMSSDVEGEFRHKVDNAMRATDNALQSVADIMAAMSKGDFSQRIEIELNGSLALLKQSVNSSVNNIGLALDDISRAVVAQKDGRFDWQIKGEHSGDLQVLKDTINDSMSSIDKALQEIGGVFSRFRNGDFSHRIQIPMAGDLNTMKENINASLSELDNAISEIVSVARAQQKGLLDQNIRGNYRGQIETLKNSLNQSGDSLNTVIHDISSVMNSLKEGDFSKRIETPMAGSFETLKIAINESLESLQNAVNDITGIARAQKDGELCERMANNHRGELYRISNAVNESMNNLTKIISDVKLSAASTMDMTQEQSLASSEMSRRTEGQAAALEEIASTMEEISSAVKSTEGDCGSMSDKIFDIKEVTIGAQQNVDKTVETMNEMLSSSQRIAQITSLIDEIAFQTNLLALNAAVEAARAGEQGRGFAVVASEVRNLAQRSADAAKEIKSLISENLTKVDDSFECSKRSSSDLKIISEKVLESHKLMENISIATEEQARGINEINSAISSLDGMTQANAAMVEQTTAAAKSVEDQARNVSQLLGFFKLADHS